MKFNQFVALAVAILAILSACVIRSENNPEPTETLRSVIPLTETMDSVTGTVTQTGIPTDTLMPTEVPTTEAGTNVTLRVNNAGSPPYVVDDQGRSLYVYMNDTQYTGSSVCLDDCAVDWPPLVITGEPAAGEGIDTEHLGTFLRLDGLKQVTFNGWPLYYSNQDTVPGNMNGQTYNGVWFLISPIGKPIQK